MSFDVPFIRPVFPPAEVVAADVADIVESNWFTNFGPKERLFRQGLVDYLGSGTDVATFCNATLALVAALSVMLEGRPVGGFVIVPSFTFAAGPEAIRWVGREPLFIDIDEQSVQPSLPAARAALADHRGRVDAILFCNTFGIGAEEIGDWEALAAEEGIPLVVDSAAGFGSVYSDGSRVGTRGDCEVFSFHATKPFAIGEGGAVAARDARIAEACRSFSNFGFGSGGAIRAGLNGKLQEINAAIGIRQLAGFDADLVERRLVLERYRAAFEPTGLGRLVPHARLSSVCFASILVDDERRRDALLADYRAEGIEARVYYAPPVHLQPAFASAPRASSLRVTESVSARMLALPAFQGMAEDTFDTIARVAHDRLRRDLA